MDTAQESAQSPYPFSTAMKSNLTVLILAAILPVLRLSAQTNATPANIRLQGFDQRKALKNNSLLKTLKPESIGPSVFSCRVTDLDVNPDDPTEMYVAYASGGLWHSKNNGISFNPVFDHESSMSIGDIAVDWKNRIIWVGTGEVNSSRSSYSGTGVFKSTDNGKTWLHCGLPESHHIGKIVVHPNNPDIAWVAALGHLYSSNPERGIFKTNDGGKSWQHTLFVNDNSGCVDLVMEPSNPDILYAASWERTRQAWNFSGAGEGSDIWKSSDGGNTWVQVSKPGCGFPTGEKVGRIGLAAGEKDGKSILYAYVDNQYPKAKKESAKIEGLTKDDFRSMSKEAFLKLSDEKLGDFLMENDFPEKYSARKVKAMVEKDKIQPIALVEYLEDANTRLFETDYTGAELYRSEDGGLSWKKTHSDPIEQMNFTYGYYFSTVRCMPKNADQVYMVGFLIIRSEDGGKTWKNINGDNVHVDHHALWLNPSKPGHLVNGNDGGVNISWDNGENWLKCNNPPVGQFYAIATDESEPYNVYGGAQDNGVWVGSSNYSASSNWHQSGQYPYKELLGGDGMQIQIDTRDNNTVYTGFQFGNYFRIKKSGGRNVPITPKHDLGERPLRFNWQTPIHLSRHQQDVLYFGANRLYRSLNQGSDWEAISGDLTQGGKAGNVPYGTLSSIHESPLKFGLIYAGSDDGLVHVTKDGGNSWSKISNDLPQNLWVSRVQASAHERSRVYVSLNGYRFDDFNAYLYLSDDFGVSWKKIGLNLPPEPINVVKEDPGNPNVLYVGTDHQVYVSLDQGMTFQTLSDEFPDVPVHDLVLQSSAKDLIIGTHGRSMFKADVSLVQELTTETLNTALVLFDIKKKKYSRNWGRKQPYTEIKDPLLPVRFYSSSGGTVNWKVLQKEQKLELNSGKIEAVKGLNNFDYSLWVKEDAQKKYKENLQATQKEQNKSFELEKADSGKVYLRKGMFTFVLEMDGKRVEKDFQID
jgi:photosystem II stability/assembly factor-like uncharacterized protein